MNLFDTEKAIFGAITARLENTPEESVLSYANPFAEEIIGPQLVGMSVVDFFSLLMGNREQGRIVFDNLLEEGSIRLETQYLNYYIYLNSVIDKKKRHFQASLFDISERKRAQQVFEYTAAALARAAEVFDDDTGEHINRINILSGKLAALAGKSAEFVANISFYAQLHDVGKVHVDPNIIRKPGRLTEAEFTQIKKHTIYGAKIIGRHPAMEMARRIALAHHERWDGNGYPYGIAGESIPIEARIVTIVDVFDALMSPRPYKPAFKPERVRQIFTVGDDRLDPAAHFDPRLLELFLGEFDSFVRMFKEAGLSDAVATQPVSIDGMSQRQC